LTTSTTEAMKHKNPWTVQSDGHQVTHTTRYRMLLLRVINDAGSDTLGITIEHHGKLVAAARFDRAGHGVRSLKTEVLRRALVLRSWIEANRPDPSEIFKKV